MLLIYVLSGCILGFMLGMIPSLHINAIAYIFLFSGFFKIFPNNFYFFISVALSQLVASFVPSTFFGVPNDQTVMCIFPAQKFFIKGKAKQAIFLTMFGSFLGLIFSILLLPLLYLLFMSLFNFNQFILLVIFLVLFNFIFSEKNTSSKLIVLSIIIFSGVLGIFTLRYNFFIKNPLMVCITGLFAFPMLIKSIFEKKEYIKQTHKTNEISFKGNLLVSILGVISSLFIILVPSFSSSQAATIVYKLKRKLSSSEYLITFSSIAISSLIFSIFLVINFSKPRLGYLSILLFHNVIPRDINYFILVLIFFISVSFSIFLVLIFLDSIIVFLNNVNMNKINLFILIISLVLIILISGINSIPLLILSTIIGSLPILYNKSRVILMAYIMIPTLLFYI